MFSLVQQPKRPGKTRLLGRGQSWGAWQQAAERLHLAACCAAWCSVDDPCFASIAVCHDALMTAHKKYVVCFLVQQNPDDLAQPKLTQRNNSRTTATISGCVCYR